MGSYDKFFLSMGILKVIEIISDQIKFLYLKYKNDRLDETCDGNEKQT